MHRTLAFIRLASILTFCACSRGNAAVGDSSEDRASGAALIANGKPTLNQPCNIGKDGWQPAPIEVPASVRAAIDAGEPAGIPIPKGYQHIAPAGMAYCERRSNGDFWAIRCNSDADCPAGSLCPFENGNTKCEPTCSTDSECTAGALCRERGERSIKLCTCAAPNWCDDPPGEEM
jgi:hypothetical protein